MVAEAAFDINENQRKGGGQAQADVLNIGPRNGLHALAVLSARATKSFLRQRQRNSHS